MMGHGTHLEPIGILEMHSAIWKIIINTIRQGTTIRKGLALYRKLLSEADGEAKQLPYDMLLYLAEHQERFRIKL